MGAVQKMDEKKGICALWKKAAYSIEEAIIWVENRLKDKTWATRIRETILDKMSCKSGQLNPIQ